MLIEGTELENLLKKILQKKIRLNLKNKVYKKGKLVLFKQNNYHLEFTIENKDCEIKKFEIPIPFAFEEWEEDNLIYFDYRFFTLAKGNDKLYDLLKNLPKEGNNKFYDTILEIEII